MGARILPMRCQQGQRMQRRAARDGEHADQDKKPGLSPPVALWRPCAQHEGGGNRGKEEGIEIDREGEAAESTRESGNKHHVEQVL